MPHPDVTPPQHLAPAALPAPGPAPAGQPAWSEPAGPVTGGSSGPAPSTARRRHPVLTALLVAIVVAGLGAPLGWLWAVLAPRLVVIKSEDGFFYADPEPEQAIAADGWFALLGLVLGVVIAVLTWILLRRHRGVAVMLAIAIGSLAAAWLAWWVGTSIGLLQFEHLRDTAVPGQRVDAPLSLRITNLSRESPLTPLTTGVAAVQALVAALVYTTLAGFSAEPDLNRGGAGQIRDALTETVDQGQFGPGRTGRSDSDAGTART